MSRCLHSTNGEKLPIFLIFIATRAVGEQTQCDFCGFFGQPNQRMTAFNSHEKMILIKNYLESSSRAFGNIWSVHECQESDETVPRKILNIHNCWGELPNLN